MIISNWLIGSFIPFSLLMKNHRTFLPLQLRKLVLLRLHHHKPNANHRMITILNWFRVLVFVVLLMTKVMMIHPVLLRKQIVFDLIVHVLHAKNVELQVKMNYCQVKIKVTLFFDEVWFDYLHVEVWCLTKNFFTGFE